MRYKITIPHRIHKYLLHSLILLCLLITTCYLFTVYNTQTRVSVQDEPLVLCPLIPKSNSDCYYSLDDDALPSAEAPSFTTGNKSIFFHESSCRGGINSRQACAVESAARLHPDWQITLLFSAPVTKHVLQRTNLAKLNQFQNIKFARLHLEKYAKDTIVETIFTQQIKKSMHLIEHVADILRILTLHKFGGVYLDTDSLLIKSLETLPDNWIAKQSKGEIASGAISFSKDGIGGKITTAILSELNSSFIPDSWSYNGPQAIQRVLERICPKILANLVNGDCGGIQVLAPEDFYPIHYKWYSVYFKNVTIASMEGPYMHHMWNYLSKELTIEKDSPYDKLAKKFCPTIHEMYGDKFGI